MVAFGIWFCSSLILLPQIDIGLDQEVTMPRDSFVLKYFNFLKRYLAVGPPVYFVLNNTGLQLDLSQPQAQNKLCGSQSCNLDSLQAQIKSWSKKSNVTYIASHAQSWIDDYFDWSRDCCVYNTTTDGFCPSDTTASDDDQGEYDYDGDYFYGDYEDAASVEAQKCQDCKSRNKLRPENGDFAKQLPWFLQDNPSISCPKGGRAAYKDAVRLNSNGKVTASSFFTFHSVLKSSKDYYQALKWSRALADNLTAMIDEPNTNVFAYSIFYVFYEQYLTMIEGKSKHKSYLSEVLLRTRDIRSPVCNLQIGFFLCKSCCIQ